MFWRALFAFVACPGIVGFLVPILFVGLDAFQRPFRLLGLIPLALGTVLLLWCVRDFYVVGKGTLAPWSPPRHLVAVGLYRYSRNPMYIAVNLVLLGWAIGFWSRGLLVYALAVMLAFHLRVVLAEELWLARTHGEEWERYKARVPRWLF
jgi:protein-S-isoprenylcysteine O-methyltransferase Ste14